MSDETEVLQDELTALKQRADLMGIPYHPSIGVEKLREKVRAALADTKPADPVPAQAEPVRAEVKAAGETATQKRVRLKQEASKLVRIRLTCMNPAKSEWDGEIITAGNAAVGSFKKFIPFHAEEGWHVPQIILDVLKERQCQIFTTVTDHRGNKLRKGKLIKEFNIEILPNLTEEELKELARRQAMSRSVDAA